MAAQEKARCEREGIADEGKDPNETPKKKARGFLRVKRWLRS